MKTMQRVSTQFYRASTLDKRDQVEIDINEDGTKFIVSFFQISPLDGTRSSPSYRATQFAERIPERKQLNTELHSHGTRWSFAASDITAVMFQRSWSGDNQISFSNEFAELTYKYLLTSYYAADSTARLVARYKNYKEVPGDRVLHVDWTDLASTYVSTITSLDMHEEFPLAAYQQVATHCSMQSTGYALFMGTGTGKTAVAIANICNLAPAHKETTGRAYRTLIVVPKNVRTNWVDEIEKFRSCKGKVTVLRGGQIERVKLLIDAMTTAEDDQFTAILVSYETMRRMIEAFKLIKWDICILDEGHFIKTPGNKRSKAAWELRDVSTRRLILTGTPVANTPFDLYSQLEFLEKGASGFMSWEGFKHFYGVYEKTDQGRTLVGIQNLPFMKERLAARSFIITKEEALPQLPDKVYDVIEVTMTPEQREAYNEIRKHLILEIENALDAAEGAKKSMVIQNSLTKLLRLAQITSGFVTWDAQITETGDIISPKEIEFFSPNAKLNALVEILQEKTPKDKTIIWACWVPDIRAISQRLKQENIRHVVYFGATSDIDRDAAIKMFNEDPLTTVFIGNAGAGGAGVNLLGYPPGHPEKAETNANHVIYFSQDWSQIKRSQSEDRAHRRGTREPVRVTDLCVANTIDEEIRARVLKKKAIAWEVLDVKEILRSILRGVIDDE